ncbi:hypothetical protein [Sphingomonas solaris]|uniref:Uncharacterized protein n=1 Tax=Alterirhizorhabdus solaris TaxID=2529389 RepID=A0A558R538_9SPHN|nr:hypothetical protein [Sphingomonas solaris]TVV74467.1 hypothetical protein FOY91_09815 [Sphingomonas solaris]
MDRRAGPDRGGAAARRRYPGTPQTACCDTGFNEHLPAIAAVLPVPMAPRAVGVRRYDFHGRSCANSYQRTVTELDTHPAADAGESAWRAIRALVEKVVVHPGNARDRKRREMQLHGDLFAMLEIASPANGNVMARNGQLPQPGMSGEVVIPLVAETCSHFD